MRSSRPYDRTPRARLLTLCVAALASLANIAPAAAQDVARPPAHSGFGSAFRAPALRADPPAPAEWVKRTRPTIIPDASRPSSRAEPQRPLMNAEQIRRREAELDALRIRQDRLAGRKATRGRYRSAAGDPVVKPKPETRKCILTCAPIGRLEKK